MVQDFAARSGSPSRRELRGLTGLRGVAALWVFFYHATFGAAIPVLSAGYLGVDVFFVLSGFILCYAYPITRWDWSRYARFLQARVARLWPMHVVALALLAAIVTFIPSVPAGFGAGAAQRFGVDEFIASLLLVQNWGVFGATNVWNVPAWSLSAEWFASLVFPAVAVGASLIGDRRLALLASLSCIVALGLGLALMHDPSWSVNGRAGMVRMAFEFAAGACLCRAAALGLQINPVTTGIAIVALAAGLVRQELTLLTVLAMPILVLSATQAESILSRWLSWPPIHFLGEISYSFYLLHWMLLLVGDRASKSLGLTGPVSLAWTLGELLVVIGLSTAAYRLIEVPVRNLMRPRRVAGLGAGELTLARPAS